MLLSVNYPYSARRGKVKGLAGLVQESSNLGTPPSVLPKVNFSHGNEVTTEFIFNADAEQQYRNRNYSYAIELNPDDETILSLWYVIGIQRTTLATACQYRLTLRRDVVTEYFDKYKNRKFYAEKGWLNAMDSPLLFQPEGINTDKVKKAEYPISDETRCQWIVGYLPPDFKSAEIKIDQTEEKSPSAVMSFKNKDSFYSYIGALNTSESQLAFNSYQIGVQYKISIPRWAPDNGVIVKNGDSYFSRLYPSPKGDFTSFSYPFLGVSDQRGLQEAEIDLASKYLGNINVTASEVWSFLRDNVDNIPTGYLSANGYLNLKGLDGQIIYIEDEKKNYKVSFSSSIFENRKTVYYAKTTSDLFAKVKNAVKNVTTSDGEKMGENSVVLAYSADSVKITLTESPYNAMTFTLPSASSVPTAKNGPYKIFCLPFFDGNINVGSDVNQVTGLKIMKVSKDMASRIASAISVQLSDSLYDIQILPYCPARETITSLVFIKPDSNEKTVYECFALGKGILTFAKDGQGNNVFPIVWTGNDSGTFYRNVGKSRYLGYSLSTSPASFVYKIDDSLDIQELSFAGGLDSKVKDITQLWRMVSPNFQGQAFEFSPQRNNGVSSFRVDFTYKPYSPFIIVRPKFSGLYGNDFGDDRGLVCGGDFSMPSNKSEWANYQLRNVNYENIFNRQYTSMDLALSQERLSGILSSIGGVGQGIAKGAQTGAVGGPIGAIVGGVVGGGLAVGGGIADYQLSEQLRKDRLGSAKDLFRMNLENIQARPQSLARGGYQITINREFPFLEFYEAPDNEINAIYDNIIYGGMSIGRDMSVKAVIAKKGNSPMSYTWVRGRFDAVPTGLSNEVQTALNEEFDLGIYMPSDLADDN